MSSFTNRLQITFNSNGDASSSNDFQSRQSFKTLDNYNNQYRDNDNDNNNNNDYQSKIQRTYQTNIIENIELTANNIKQMNEKII